MSRTLVAQNRGQKKSRFLAKVFDVSSVFSLPKTSTQLCSRKVTVNGILMVYLQFLQRRFGLENGKFHQSIVIQTSRKYNITENVIWTENRSIFQFGLPTHSNTGS